jgi:hypothetical protein
VAQAQRLRGFANHRSNFKKIRTAFASKLDKNVGWLRTGPSSLSASVASNAAKNIGRKAGIEAAL